jgi:hypothetical protein
VYHASFPSCAIASTLLTVVNAVLIPIFT